MELNKLYCIDNLELLRNIPSSSIDLIYCDVLYNTGKKFNDYDDNLGTPQEAIEWYRPRLIEMKRALKDTGSIYLQMDYRLVHYMKVEMDNIFGINNFRNHIIWSYKSGGATPKDRFNTKHDDILLYSGGKSNTFNILKDKSYLEKEHGFKNIEQFIDECGRKYTLVNMRDVWEVPIIDPRAFERVGYNTQKPKALLERIIKASSNEGDVVADFFIGSGTSMVVAKELGRNYIGCDINPRAVEIAEERLKDLDK